MKSDQWKTYRTRFLVKAKQLSSSLSFTDHLGRQHCGRKGDYLVESYDGVLSIAPRQIFEDVYVPMSQPDLSVADQPGNISSGAERNELSAKQFVIDALHVDPVHPPKLSVRAPEPRRAVQQYPARIRRKSPQPVRSAHASSQIGLM